MANENLSTDIYGVNEYVNNIKKNYITDVNEDTLMLGIFGYLGQIHSDMLQNSIIMASEFSNESIATKAKFEKNIIAHALGLGITDINAVPAQMDVLLTFIENDIINWANAITADGEELPWTFVFDKDNPIYFGDYEFHTDYDIVIKKVEVTTQGPKKRFAYTAQYDADDMAIPNPVAPDNLNPYLTPPVKVNLEGMNVIFTRCTIRQVTKAVQSTKVLADNDVSAKTITFTFEGQLAGFSLDVTEGSETYHMIPVYEGLNVDTAGQLYFWYTYLDSNTIRIKFDRNSRIPAVNANVQINIQTTQGYKGNFTFYDTNYPEFSFESERLNYSNITCQVRPVDGSAMYGTDKKSIEELKQIIPKEALSRGAITNLTDLENYFNQLDTDYSKLYFYKKRDNCLERLYYSFIIMKNDLNIIPTNTVNLAVSTDDMISEDGSNKLILKQGQTIILTPGDEEARLLGEGELLPEEDGSTYDGSFAYYLPYDFIISQSPLYGMYIMTTIHSTKILDFEYINEDCQYQYIATKVNWDRNCLENHNTYKMSIDFQQNIIPEEEDRGDAPIYTNDDGELVCNVDVYVIIFDKDGNAHRWAKGTLTNFDDVSAILSYEFTFTTEDYIDNDNRIRIDTGLYDIGNTNESYAHLNDNMTTKIYVVSKQGPSKGLGEPAINTYIPEITADSSLSNTYNIISGLDFFYDYSNIVKSTVTVTRELIPIEPEEPEEPDPGEDPEEPGGDTDPEEPGGDTDPDQPGEGEEEDPGGGDQAFPTRQEILFENLGVVLEYVTDLEMPVDDPQEGEPTTEIQPHYYIKGVQLYDKNKNKLGGVIPIPNGSDYITFSQDPTENTLKIYLDPEKDTYIEVNIGDLSYVDPVDPDPGGGGEDPDPGPQYETKLTFHIVGIPVVKYGYFDTEDTAKLFFNELVNRKNYIEEALMLLEDAFEMDFKFFNTYGPSRFFTWDNGTDVIDRVNISLFFKLKLKPNYDTNIVEDIRADIKEYVENINQITSLHIPNLITYITNSYRDSIEYFEFVSINGMDASYQHIYAMDVPDGIMVPEFVNINTLPGSLPDINIELV